VLHEGQPVKVKIQKIDPTSGKISLSIRDIIESPWTHAAQKYPPKTKVTGRVTKIMEFGAFVELEPGIEGLVHISELSHQRVWRTADVVSEGQEVEAQVVSVDADKQRIALSMKAVQARPEPKKAAPEAEEPEGPAVQKKKQTAPLKGGRATKSGGEQFGLKW
jgi:small subunit ribosomal protein S1